MKYYPATRHPRKACHPREARHPRAGGDPTHTCAARRSRACAGMTKLKLNEPAR